MTLSLQLCFLMFADDIVFAAVFVYLPPPNYLCRAPARWPSCMYAGRPFALAGYIESKIVKNVRTNHTDSCKILLKYLQFHLVCMTTFESVTRQHLKQW